MLPDIPTRINRLMKDQMAAANQAVQIGDYRTAQQHLEKVLETIRDYWRWLEEHPVE